MTTDWLKAKKIIENSVEVKEWPYEFEKDCPIHYITLKDNKDKNSVTFYTGGKFLRREDDDIRITYNWCNSNQGIPVSKYIRDPLGNIIYNNL